jgi:hypothetical protein
MLPVPYESPAFSMRIWLETHVFITYTTLHVYFYSGKSFLMQPFHKTSYKFQTTNSILYNNTACSGSVEEQLDYIGARFGTSTTKLFVWFVQQMNQKLLHLHSCRITGSQTLWHKLWSNTFFFFNWCLYEIHDGEIDSTFILFGCETWFHLSGYVNSQNNRYWSTENTMLIH